MTVTLQELGRRDLGRQGAPCVLVSTSEPWRGVSSAEPVFSSLHSVDQAYRQGVCDVNNTVERDATRRDCHVSQMSNDVTRCDSAFESIT
jgi:hypothetical protein